MAQEAPEASSLGQLDVGRSRFRRPGDETPEELVRCLAGVHDSHLHAGAGADRGPEPVEAGKVSKGLWQGLLCNYYIICDKGRTRRPRGLTRPASWFDHGWFQCRGSAIILMSSNLYVMLP